MSWEKYSFNNYLHKELKFWKSMKAVYLDEETKNKVSIKLKGKFKEEHILNWAEKRFNSLMTLLRIFKEPYKKRVANLIKEKIDIDLFEVVTLDRFRKKYEKRKFDWLDNVIIIVETVFSLAALTAADLVAEDTYLTCEEIKDLTYYWSWVEYLLMIKSNRAEYITALVCANCNFLRLLVNNFNQNHQLILSEDPHWLEAFFYAARLEECDIPY